MCGRGELGKSGVLGETGQSGGIDESGGSVGILIEDSSMTRVTSVKSSVGRYPCSVKLVFC